VNKKDVSTLQRRLLPLGAGRLGSRAVLWDGIDGRFLQPRLPSPAERPYRRYRLEHSIVS
jgi:hypothetical protein